MDFIRFFVLMALVFAVAVALPSPASDSIEKLKSGVKKPLVRFPVGEVGLTRTRRQFGGYGGASSYASANANSGAYGGSPYGFPGYGGAYSGASANAYSGSQGIGFGR